MSQENPPVPPVPPVNPDVSATAKLSWIGPAIPWAVALIAYLVAIRISPETPGCACFNRWQLFPFILVAFAIAAAAYFQRRSAVPVGDNAPMPSAARLVLTLYLLAFGASLVFMLVSLSSLDFPDTPVMPEQPAASPTPTPGAGDNQNNTAAQNPAATPAPGANQGNPAQPNPAVAGTAAGQNQSRTAANTTPTTPVAPTLLRAFPQSTVGSTPTISLTVYGEHFSDDSVVRFNGQEVEPSEYLSPSLLTAKLEPRHLANVGSITVDVKNGNLLSNALVVPVVKPTVPLNVFFCWKPSITREVQLLLLVIFAGALGSYLHAIMSLADFIGNRTLKASWFWWYISRPFLGMAMALVFYAVVRGGFLAGTPADANVVNPFGVVAIGALVGMFSDKAAQKLKQIFDVVFTSNDERADKLNKTLVITPTGGAMADATAGVEYKQSLDVSGGTAPFTWSLATNPTWLKIDETTGILSGLPGAEDVGDVNEVTINVVDSLGATGEAKLNLKVTAEPPP